MSRQTKPALEKQIEEVRSRLQFGYVEGAYHETGMRIFNLKQALKEFKDESESELLRYFPVASIAALEAHFRATVSLIVNEGGDYFERGLRLIAGDKLKVIDVIPMIHNKTVTVGDLVAYSLPFSSLKHLVNTYDAILGLDFKRLASTVEDPYFSRQEWQNRQPLAEDIPKLWRELIYTFEARHILAHESASQYKVSLKQAYASVESVEEIVKLIEAVLWETVWKEKPLTQYEMNVSAFKQYRSTRLLLSRAIREKRHELEGDHERSTFRKLHLQWKKWSWEWCNFSADRFKGGSIRPMIFASCLNESAQNRLEEIKDMTGY